MGVTLGVPWPIPFASLRPVVVVTLGRWGGIPSKMRGNLCSVSSWRDPGIVRCVAVYSILQFIIRTRSRWYLSGVMSRSRASIASLASRGKMVEQQKNSKLTNEQEEEVVDIFKLFDSDRDGLVTKFELKEALWSLGQHPGEEEMDAMFREYDTNNNGTLDCTEFRRLITNRLSYKNTRAEFAEAFRAIDRDKDGSLDIGELQRLMAATGCGLTDQELAEIFGIFDKDGSGKVDLAEFMDYMMGA